MRTVVELSSPAQARREASSATSTTRTASRTGGSRKGSGSSSSCEIDRLWSTEYGGPPDWLERSIEHLAAHTRAVTPGTFVFVLSDFVP